MSVLSLLFCNLTLLTGCKDKDTDSVVDDDTGDTGTVEADTTCADLGLEAVPFSDEAPTVYQRRQPAGDFSVPLRDGTTWTLSENWTGCETYVFLPHWWPISALDDTSYWFTGVDDLIERSPENVHYFFVVAGSSADDAEGFGSQMQTDIDETLASMDDAEREWWLDRLHVVDGPSDTIEGLVGDMFGRDISIFGWAIDREQHLRTTGYFPAAEAYNATLNNMEEWPWEFRLYSAADEAVYFNYEAERQARLDAVDATIVEVFGGDVIEEYEDGTMVLPDAATMAGFDTLEIDVLMECPDKDLYEISNCGAWDYLAYFWLYDEESKSFLEMSRFITTYHRESRWVADASFALAWLKDGGERAIRYEWAPSWNTQPTGVTIQLRLSNQGKGTVPDEIIPLFTGGTFSTTYNDDRPPVEVEVPADAAKVELVSIATGHGIDTYSCAEYCNHSHHFTIGGQTFSQEFPEAATETGCSDTVNDGTVPNQAGSWWFGRGGWCPGREVDPMVEDITDIVSLGATNEVAYEAKINGGAPIDSAGNVVLNSYMIIHR